MYNVLLDLELAEARRHELEAQAARERLALRAVREHKADHHDTVIDRLLSALKARRPHSPTDRRVN
jgi:hypothetical protein